MPAAEIGDRISASELLRWELLEAVDPWGDRRADLRLAILCWTMFSCHARRPPSFAKVLKQVNELLGIERPEQSDEQIAATFEAMAKG